MGAVRRRGDELRTAVRRRRRARALGIASMTCTIAVFSLLVSRDRTELFGLFVAALAANCVVLLLHLTTFLPRSERRMIRREITSPAATRAQARRWALRGGLISAALALVLLVAIGLLGSWLTGAGVAAPVLLLGVVWAIAFLREGRRSAGP